MARRCTGPYGGARNNTEKVENRLENMVRDTIVLPEWTSILQQHTELSREADEEPLSIRMMPRDVSTRYNSTFDMIQFAVTYCDPLNDLTGCRAMNLRDYELTEDEWKIAEQLSGVLDVIIAPVLDNF
jgi:hypothetical protein